MGTATSDGVIKGFVHPDFVDPVAAFAKEFAHADMGGAALSVMQHGETVVDVWTGTTDIAGTNPWCEDTLAMSFSTTKGVASMALHLLVDRGLVAYDQPVASYWPDFGASGKEHITIREMMTHRAGLHDARHLVDSPRALLDAEAMTKLVVSQAPDPMAQETSGYHAVTYGWLVGGVVRAVTGRSLTQFVQDELAGPLGVDGLHIGAPMSQRHRIAPLIPLPTPKDQQRIKKLTGWMQKSQRLERFVDALLVEDFDDLIYDPDLSLADTEMAAVNGFLNARSLARMYSILANGGVVDGQRFLSQSTIDDLGQIQVRSRDYVIQIPMLWRTGFHRAFVTGRHQPKRGFGHFGYGGSGGWADLDTGMSIGFTLNKLSVTTPMADMRLAKIGGAAWKAAQSR